MHNFSILISDIVFVSACSVLIIRHFASIQELMERPVRLKVSERINKESENIAQESEEKGTQ
jgi:hypothetical protein